MSTVETKTLPGRSRAAAPPAVPEVRPIPWRSWGRTYSTLALAGADAAAWLFSSAIIYLLRAVLWTGVPFLWVTWFAGLVWIVFRAASGLYPPVGISQPEEVRRSVYTTMGAALTHVAMLVALGEVVGWRLLGLGIWLLVIPIAWFCRSLTKLFLLRQRVFGDPYVVIGTGPKARLVIQEMKANPELGLIPVGVFGNTAGQRGSQIEEVPVLGSVDEAERYPFPYPVRHVIVALGTNEATADDLLAIENRLARRYPSINLFSNLAGAANLWTQPRPLGPYLMLETQHARFSARQRLLKRTFDLVVGVPAFLAALPVIAVCAALVKIFSPGPAFFAQEREGHGGRRIKIWKIRSMVPNAEQRLAEFLANDPEARFEWERFLKLRKDPRIIPMVGAFMRKFSLDELPQLWGVITGDLTLVGPRVFAIWHVERFPTEFRELRHQVPPGLTGLWQVSYRNSGDLTVQERVDSYYIQNWSLWLDMWILLRTVRVVLVGSGAY